MITTYAELQTAVGNWLNRADLDSYIPDFITLLEGRLNRVLRVPDMEEVVEQSVTEEAVALPADFLEARLLFINGDPDTVLEQVSPATLRKTYPYAIAGSPSVYAIRGGEVIVAPAPEESKTLTLVYYQKIPALSDSNTSNWLLAAYPDVYLFGALTMAEAFLKDDERVGIWKGAWDEALAEIMENGKRQRYQSGPLHIRASYSA